MVDRRPECPECGVKVPSTGHLVLFPCPRAMIEVVEEWTPDKHIVTIGGTVHETPLNELGYRVPPVVASPGTVHSEKIPQPELPAAPQRTTNSPNVPQHVPQHVPLTPEISTTNRAESVPLTRNRKWEAAHPEYKDWKRNYQREYMRRRRAE